MEIFECYLIWVNVIGFFLYLFNMFLYLHTENVQVDAILTICSLIGGSAGILWAILLFDRKAVKDNMMSRVFIACYAVDKVNAADHRSRIRIVTLLGLAFVGGSVGSLLAMYLLRHKTRKNYFTVGVPLIMVMQVVVIFYAMNAGW